MVNYFKTLLPVTTVVDDVLVPKYADRVFFNEHRFYIVGLHCTWWMKLYVAGTLLTCVTFSENWLEEAANAKANYYESGRTFNGVIDVFYELDFDSFAFRSMYICAIMLFIAIIFSLIIITNLAYFLIPFQFVLFITFHYLLKQMARVYTENISIFYELYIDMDESLIDMEGFNNRDSWFFSEMGLPPKYEPIARNAIYIGAMTTCLSLEYFFERIMQFYGYEKFLIRLNRPVVVAYRKWQFKKMMQKRRTHQKARLIRRHQNVNGNFTWNGIIRNDDVVNDSLHTAISPDTSVHTAIEWDSNEDLNVNVPNKKVRFTNKQSINVTCKF